MHDHGGYYIKLNMPGMGGQMLHNVYLGVESNKADLKEITSKIVINQALGTEEGWDNGETLVDECQQTITR